MDDLISRQAAIDAVRTYYDEQYALTDSIEELIEKLPSAQTEQTYCDYCHEDSDGFVRPIENNSHAVIYGSVLHLRAKGWSGKAPINFCPICGRRLNHG